MIFKLNELFVNIPKTGYCFDLPELLYTEPYEAALCLSKDDKTVTLEEAFKQIADDIKHDA